MSDLLGMLTKSLYNGLFTTIREYKNMVFSITFYQNTKCRYLPYIPSYNDIPTSKENRTFYSSKLFHFFFVVIVELSFLLQIDINFV